MKILKKILKVFTVACIIIFMLGLIIFKMEGGSFKEAFTGTSESTTEAENTSETAFASQTEIQTEPKQNAETQSEYMKLTNDKEAYLLFLRIIGTCYRNNTLTTEIYDEMASHSEIQFLVEDMMNYRYNNGKISPDFQDSFSAFWTDEMTSTETKTVEALKNSFEISYDFIKKIWIIEENEATAVFHAVYKVNGEDYRDFEGRLNVGDIIYLRDEGEMIPYFEVLNFGENMKINGDEVSENTVQVRELYSIMGEDLTSYWRDLDDMLEHNKETREEDGYPVYYVKE